MAWQRLLGSGQLVLFAYFAVNTVVIVTNPAKVVTQTTIFEGGPIANRSNEFRQYLATEHPSLSNVTWELDIEACGFAYAWQMTTHIAELGFNQDDNLCVRHSSVDYYAIEGVDVMSPMGMEAGCGEETEEEVFVASRDCDVNVTQHYFNMSWENINSLGLQVGASSDDVELKFAIGSRFGVYGLTEPQFICQEPVGLSAECALIFQFYEETNTSSIAIRNSTVGVKSDILDELSDLASRDWLPYKFSKSGMEDELCVDFEASEELLDCSIVCNPTYPYSSSSCVGTYEEGLVPDVAHRFEIILTMAAVTVACWLSLSTMRLGMRTPNGRSRRGYLGAGGSSQHFFEEEGDQGDRVGLANPIPPMQVAKIGTQGIKISSFSGSVSRTGGQAEDRLTIAGLGIVICSEVKEIPREMLSTTGKPVTLGDPQFVGSFRSRSDSCANSGTVPICFIVQENLDGSVENLDVEEVHRLLDESGGRALLDESFGGDHLAWARGFSVVDAVGCLLTLWTVHFVAANSGWGSYYWVAALVAFAKWLEETDVNNLVRPLLGGVQMTPKLSSLSAPPLPLTLAVMEVLYDLSIPGVEIFGLIVTVLWTVIVVALCGYFIFHLGYEPIYSGGGIYSTKVSLQTALAVGGALNCPFALAGDWVRGSRCGDTWGRLAVSFCLASPDTRHATRVSHVNSRAELQSTSLETGVLCGDGGGSPTA